MERAEALATPTQSERKKTAHACRPNSALKYFQYFLVDVPFFVVKTDIPASPLACHERSEPVFLFLTAMFVQTI
jgi:hypothetical protein